MSDRDLQHSFDAFGESVAEYAFSRVQEALALERDRHDEEIAELRDEWHTLADNIARWQHAHMFELHNANAPDPIAELRDRHDAEIANLHRIVSTQGAEVARLRGIVTARWPEGTHSVKVTE